MKSKRTILSLAAALLVSACGSTLPGTAHAAEKPAADEQAPKPDRTVDEADGGVDETDETAAETEEKVDETNEGQNPDPQDSEQEQQFSKKVSYERLNLIQGIAVDLAKLKEANSKALKIAKVSSAFAKADVFVEEATELVYVIDETEAGSTQEDIQTTRLMSKTAGVIGTISVLVTRLESTEQTNSLIMSLVDKLEKLRKI